MKGSVRTEVGKGYDTKVEDKAHAYILVALVNAQTIKQVMFYTCVIMNMLDRQCEDSTGE